MAQSPFTPMLPGDDQLIHYGDDTSIAIQHSLPAELQSTALLSASAIINKEGKFAGVKLMNRTVRTTRKG